jgi:pimeloyl-ACP methyl ester carboxylesterase
MYTFETLPLHDQWDKPIPHRFLRRAIATEHAALLLPGAEIVFLHPALYYCVIACMRAEADILWVGYNARPGFLSRSMPDQLNQAKRDTVDAYQALLAQCPYQRLTLIGKSLGTLAMGHLLATTRLAMPTQAIWLTPLFQDQDLREQLRTVRLPSLFVIGTRDAQYDPAYVRALRDWYRGKGEALVLEGADHGLEVGAEAIDMLGSLRALAQVMCAIEAFLRPQDRVQASIISSSLPTECE